MTKAGLEVMIAALKDRCKKSMECRDGFVPCACISNEAHKHAKGHRPISSEQMISLSALVAYVAHVTHSPEYRVERDLSDFFCIANPKCLSFDQYEQAVRYLVDQVPPHSC